MKKALTFAFCVCLFSWTVYGIACLAMGDALRSSQTAMTVLKSVYMFFPMLVAIALKAIGKEPVFTKDTFRLNLGWPWAAALSIPVIAVILTLGISILMPGVRYHYGVDQLAFMNGLDESTAELVSAQLAAIPAGVMIIMTIVEGLLAGCTVNAVFSFGEEFGWRGYMVDAMKGESFMKKTLFIGFVWGIWHAPLVLAGHNYPQHPVAGVGMMCIFCILVGFVELYFREKTGSVVIAACIHGTINAIAALVVLLVQGGSDLTIGLSGAAGFIALAIICACIWMYDKRCGPARIII